MRSKGGLGANPKVRFSRCSGLLRDLGVKLVVGYEGIIRGACPLDGAGPDAERAFQDITRENGGYVFLCDPTGDPEAPRHRHYARLVARILLEVRAQPSAQAAADWAREKILGQRRLEPRFRSV